MTWVGRLLTATAILSAGGICALFLFYQTPPQPQLCEANHWCTRQMNDGHLRWACSRGHWREDAGFCQVK